MEKKTYQFELIGKLYKTFLIFHRKQRRKKHNI